MARKAIGAVTIRRVRIYPLDPQVPGDTTAFVPSEVIVEPGYYPIYEDGDTRYWRMTGVLNHQYIRLGDGAFRMDSDPVRSQDDIVFYSKRYGPDEWKELVEAFAAEPDPALEFEVEKED